MLIAHLKATRDRRNSRTLPVRHETDVKKELSGVLKGWLRQAF